MVFYQEANLETLNTSSAPPTAPGDFAWLSNDGYIEWEGWEHDGRFNPPSEERMRFLIFPQKNKLLENDLAGYAVDAKRDPKKSLAIPIYRADNYAGKNVIFSDNDFDYIRIYYCTKADPPKSTLMERNAAKAQGGKNKSKEGSSSQGGRLSRRVAQEISLPPIRKLGTQEDGLADGQQGDQEDTSVDRQGDARGDAPKDEDKTDEDLANPASNEQTHEEDAAQDTGGTLFT